MAQAPTTVRAQVASLAIEVADGRLDWGDFLESLPEGIGEDDKIHELLELLQKQPPPGLVSEETYAEYLKLLREKISAL